MLNSYSRNTKVAIIGAGNVGSTIAYGLMINGCVSEIALIDINKEKAEGEMLDLQHCMQFTNVTTITSSNCLSLIKGAKIVIITAGANQKAGQSRIDLLTPNVTLFKEIIPKIPYYNNDCILLVVTNPLDVMTYITWKLSGFSSSKVLGSGTVLDTARLRFLLGQNLEISPKDITAFVLGEHGDSEFVWWSKANIGGTPLSNFLSTQTSLEQIYTTTRNAAANIINKKGATFYAISEAVVKIVRSILLNQPRIFSVSSLIQDIYGINNIYMSIPTIVNHQGIGKKLSINLDTQEQILLKKSATKIKITLDKALNLL